MSDVIALPSETVAHLDQASPTGFAQWYHDLVVVVMVSLLFSSVTLFVALSRMRPPSLTALSARIEPALLINPA